MSAMNLNVKSDDIEFGTNILKVKVPKQLRNKVKCGVDYIDSALGGGGFTPSAVTFFTGTPGSGKTTMMLKMADSLTKSGALVVFNTAEESLYQIKMTCDRLKLRQPFKVGGETRVPVLLEPRARLVEEVARLDGRGIQSEHERRRAVGRRELRRCRVLSQ